MQTTEKRVNLSKRLNNKLLSMWVPIAISAPFFIYMMLPQRAKEALQSAIAIPAAETWQYIALGAVPLTVMVVFALEMKREPHIKQTVGVIVRALAMGLVITWWMICMNYSLR